MQDVANRQNSLPCESVEVQQKWNDITQVLRDTAWGMYQTALSLGIAKEVCRALLPEGLTPTVLYMNGCLRSWIHYWDVRCTPETQKEHRLVAEAIRDVVLEHFPGIKEALSGNSNLVQS